MTLIPNNIRINVAPTRYFLEISRLIKEKRFDFLLILLLLSLFYCSFYVNYDIKQGFIVGKHFYFVLVASLIFTVQAIRTLVNENKLQIKITLIDGFLILFIVYIFLQTLILNSHNLTSNAFIEQAFMLIIFFCSKRLFRKSNDKIQYLILSIFILFTSFHALYGIGQFLGWQPSFHEEFRVTGYFFNPAPFAGYLVSSLPIAVSLYAFIKPNEFWKKVTNQIGFFSMLCILVAVIFTQSRASWVALFIAVFTMFIMYYRIDFFSKYIGARRIYLSSIILIISILLTSYFLFHWRPDSIYGRLLNWKVTLQIILDNPIFGIGLERFTKAFGDQQAIYFQSGQFQSYEIMVAGKGEYAFNEYLRISVEHGLVGLILFLLIIFSSLLRFFDKTVRCSAIEYAATGGIISLVVFSFFSYPFSVTPILINFYFLLGILSASDKDWVTFKLPRLAKYLYFLIVCILCAGIFNIKSIQFEALKKWNIASQLKEIAKYDEAVGIMTRIREELKYDGAFMQEFGQTLSLNEEHMNAILVLKEASYLTSDPYLYSALGSCYQAIGNYDEAEKSYLHAFYLIPHKFYPKYLLLLLYEEQQKNDKAKAVAKEILNMKIKIPSQAVNEIREKAQETLKN